MTAYATDSPRDRLTRLGPGSLSNAELLLILTPRRDATALLADAGGLAGLCLRDNLDPAIAAALEIARRLPAATLSGRDLLNEPALVKEYLRCSHAEGTQERTGALYLTARNRLLRDDPEIYRGTLDRAVVEPREILKRALLLNAASLILYHNHPSGDPTPSREDREFTRRVTAAAESIGVRVLDHVVVGREGCVSFREAGLM